MPGLPADIGDALIAHLVTHTAGLTARPSAPIRAGDDDLGGAARRMTRYDRMTDPGAVYSFSEQGLVLSALALERAAGVPYARLATERVLEPVGMSSATLDFEAAAPRLVPGFSTSNRIDVPLAPEPPAAESALAVPRAALYATAADLARLAAAVLQDGMLDGEQRLAAGAGAALFRGAIPIPVTDGSAAGLGGTVSTWEGRPQIHVSGAGRGHTATVRILPTARLALVVLTNSGHGTMPRTQEFILDRLLPEPAASPRPDGSGSAEATSADAVPFFTRAPASALPGRYANGGELLEVVEDAGGLGLRSGELTLDVVSRDGAYHAVLDDGRTALVFQHLLDVRGRPYLFTDRRALVRLPDEDR